MLNSLLGKPTVYVVEQSNDFPKVHLIATGQQRIRLQEKGYEDDKVTSLCTMITLANLNDCY